MAKKILFTSRKGGTGVTTCAVGLGLALAQMGERTLIVDGDTESGGALIIGGCANMQVYTLADYEKGACRAKQTLLSHPKASNLCFMPSIGLSSKDAAVQAVAEVEGLFDFVLLDKIAIEACDEAVIVTEPFVPSVKSADCCRSRLSDNGVKQVSLIVNKINGGQVLSGEVMTAQEIAAILHLPLKAVIPEDLFLSSGNMRQNTARAFKIAADNFSGRKEGLCNVLRGFSGINGYIKRKMREKI